MQVTGISLLVLLLSITTAFPQELPISSRGSLSEKIYLQPDRTVYTTQETIWFKAIVTDAVYHAPTMLSGVLYVELIGPESQLMRSEEHTSELQSLMRISHAVFCF